MLSGDSGDRQCRYEANNHFDRKARSTPDFPGIRHENMPAYGIAWGCRGNAVIRGEEVFSPPRRQVRQVEEMAKVVVASRRSVGCCCETQQPRFLASLALLASWQFKFFHPRQVEELAIGEDQEGKPISGTGPPHFRNTCDSSPGAAKVVVASRRSMGCCCETQQPRFPASGQRDCGSALDSPGW